MSQIVNFLNLIATKIVDLILLPFRSIDASWGLFVISALSGILLIFIYGLVSNQKAIKNVKRKISASILEVILYRHDVVQCLKAQGRMLAAGAKYFLLAVPPLLILMIPCIIILAQLNLRYEERPLRIGENLLLTAKISENKDLMQTRLEAGDGLKISNPLRVESDNEIVWKITALKPGEQKVKIFAGDKSLLEKSVFVDNKSQPLYSKEYKSWLWTVLYPQESSSFKDYFSKLELSYPKGDNYLLSIRLHWILTFFIVSLVSGLVAAKIFKVEI